MTPDFGTMYSYLIFIFVWCLIQHLDTSVAYEQTSGKCTVPTSEEWCRKVAQQLPYIYYAASGTSSARPAGCYKPRGGNGIYFNKEPIASSETCSTRNKCYCAQVDYKVKTSRSCITKSSKEWCKEIALVSSQTFLGSVNLANVPSGCYVRDNDFYYNENRVGTSCTSDRQCICNPEVGYEAQTTGSCITMSSKEWCNKIAQLSSQTYLHSYYLSNAPSGCFFSFKDDRFRYNENRIGTSCTSDRQCICKQEEICSFETSCFLISRNDSSSRGYIWRKRTDSIPNGDTRPTGDHTSGSGAYIYAEASPPAKKNDEAYLYLRREEVSFVLVSYVW